MQKTTQAQREYYTQDGWHVVETVQQLQAQDQISIVPFHAQSSQVHAQSQQVSLAPFQPQSTQIQYPQPIQPYEPSRSKLHPVSDGFRIPTGVIQFGVAALIFLFLCKAFGWRDDAIRKTGETEGMKNVIQQVH